MNTATRTRLRITGFGLVVAALISHWAFDRKAEPAAVQAKPAQVAKAPVSAPTNDPPVTRAPRPCTQTPPSKVPDQANDPLAAGCDPASQ